MLNSKVTPSHTCQVFFSDHCVMPCTEIPRWSNPSLPFFYPLWDTDANIANQDLFSLQFISAMCLRAMFFLFQKCAPLTCFSFNKVLGLQFPATHQTYINNYISLFTGYSVSFWKKNCLTSDSFCWFKIGIPGIKLSPGALARRLLLFLIVSKYILNKSEPTAAAVRDCPRMLSCPSL